MSAYADRERAALRALAIEVLRDPAAAPADRAAARRRLLDDRPDLHRLSDGELSLWIFLSERTVGREPTGYYELHELARTAQAFADERAAAADAALGEGTRLPAPRCRRCAPYDDADLAVLAEAIAEDKAEPKVLDGATLALEGDHDAE